MANAGFSAPVEYFGQGSSAVLDLKASSDGKDYAVKATGMDERGDIIARDLAGEQISPSGDYVVKAAGDLELVLGTVNTAETKAVVLLGVEISTQGASAPTVKLNGESVQDGATASSTVTLPAITLSPRHKAQLLGSAFSFTGNDCKLQTSNFSAKVNLTRATVAGETVTHDVSGCSMVATATILQKAATAPTVTPGSGWTMTTPVAKECPDEGYIMHSFEFTKDVAGVDPA